jgi:hypothetical protein
MKAPPSKKEIRLCVWQKPTKPSATLDSKLMKQERRTLTPAEIIDYAHRLKRVYGSVSEAKVVINTLRQTVGKGKISGAYDALEALNDGNYI